MNLQIILKGMIKLKKGEYEKIVNTLKERIDLCSKHLGNIKETGDILSEKIGTLKESVAFAQKEMSIMDRFMMSELYHIIGMTNMSASQTTHFIGLVKKYLEYRPIIKRMKTVSFDYELKAPEFNVEAKYEMANFNVELKKPTLTLVKEEKVKEEVKVETLKKKEPKKVYEFIGNTIIVEPDMLEEFLEYFKKHTKFDVDTLLKKIKNESSYGGISWKKKKNKYEGVINNAGNIKFFRQFL